MNIQVLKSEIDTDPLARGYSGLSDQAAADDLNSVYRTRKLDKVSGDALLQLVNSADIKNVAVTDEKLNLLLTLCAKDEVTPDGPITLEVIRKVFGAGSGTETALKTLAVESVSRGVELGLGHIRTHHVKTARELP